MVLHAHIRRAYRERIDRLIAPSVALVSRRFLKAGGRYLARSRSGETMVHATGMPSHRGRRIADRRIRAGTCRAEISGSTRPSQDRQLVRDLDRASNAVRLQPASEPPPIKWSWTITFSNGNAAVSAAAFCTRARAWVRSIFCSGLCRHRPCSSSARSLRALGRERGRSPRFSGWYRPWLR